MASNIKNYKIKLTNLINYPSSQNTGLFIISLEIGHIKDSGLFLNYATKFSTLLSFRSKLLYI